MSYILSGIDEEFNPIVMALTTKSEPLKLGEIYCQLLVFEKRDALLHKNDSGFSANSTSRGHWEQRRRGCSSCGRTCRSRGRGFNNNSMRPHPQTRGNNSNKSNIDTIYKCQLGYKRGYTSLDYWHIFEENFVPDECYNRCAAFYVVDSN